MTHDRTIQAAFLALLVAATAGAGRLLPGIIEMSDEHALRYTDVTVEGAPPFVALGTMIGALRGLIVDYLWIKIHINKEKGLFYEVMADADLITKLQPRFAAVWAFHGHNMAYNISVATQTQQERWEWVNAGIRLVRNEGLRYNPNDLQLHRELAFWFAHKIEGVSDDAHLYYKAKFCQEWHYLLGEPPDDWDERIAWIKKVADAPATLAEAEARTPEIRGLLEALERVYAQAERPFKVDRDLLMAYAEWDVIRRQSSAAQILGKTEEYRERRPFFAAFDDAAGDPRWTEAWDTLVHHLRKRTLEDDYNMDPQVMYEYTRDLGPIDWRNAQAHALYWSRRGSEIAERRVANVNDIYKILNNDRIQLQAMQGLARYGRTYFDPFSDEMPARFPDPRWIDTIDKEFERVYLKHYRTRGGGGDTFLGFLENFLSSSVREWYRAGETEKAQRLLDRLDSLAGRGAPEAVGRNPDYSLPLDVFVWKQTLNEYEFQPHLAPSDVAASLRYGFVMGLGQDRPELLEQSKEFAKKVTEYFKGNEYNNYVNKFGRGACRSCSSRWRTLRSWCSRR